MTGRAEVARLRQLVDQVFSRASKISDAETLSDHAKYLCVIVSGFLEQAVIELLLEHTRRNSNVRVQRYVEPVARRLMNLNATKLVTLIGAMDAAWRVELEGYVIDERKAAIDSVVGLRNTIAHGRHTAVTVARVRGYYEEIVRVVDRIADLCVPV